MLEAIDKRLNTVNELLQNIRFLKFYGWGRFSHFVYCLVLLLICHLCQKTIGLPKHKVPEVMSCSGGSVPML